MLRIQSNGTLTLVPDASDTIVGTTALDGGDIAKIEITGAAEYTTTVVTSGNSSNYQRV